MHDDTPDEIAQGIKSIVAELRSRLPKTKILLLGVFPRSPQPDAARERIKTINEKIARLDDGSHVRYLDIGKAFLNADGTISPEVMPDYLHLSIKGYRLWAEAMEPTLWSMLDEPDNECGLRGQAWSSSSIQAVTPRKDPTASAWADRPTWPARRQTGGTSASRAAFRAREGWRRQASDRCAS